MILGGPDPGVGWGQKVKIQLFQNMVMLHIKLKARSQTAKYPFGWQLSQYGKWDGLILSLLSYQFEFY